MRGKVAIELVLTVTLLGACASSGGASGATTAPPASTTSADWLLRESDLGPGWQRESPPRIDTASGEAGAGSTDTTKPGGKPSRPEERLQLPTFERMGDCNIRSTGNVQAEQRAEVTSKNPSTGQTVEEHLYVFGSVDEAERAFGGVLLSTPSGDCRDRPMIVSGPTGTVRLAEPRDAVPRDFSCGVGDQCVADLFTPARGKERQSVVTVRKGPVVYGVTLSPADQVDAATDAAGKAAARIPAS